MTPDAQQPQREYIITEDQLSKIEKRYIPGEYGLRIVKDIRSRKYTQIPETCVFGYSPEHCHEIIQVTSRPHTPAPDGVQYTFDTERAKRLRKHDAAIARTVTLKENKRVIDAIKHLIEYNEDSFQCLGDTVLPKKVVVYEFLLSEEGIESLRQQAGEQE